ncbi:DUF4170 domain-containing protein [Allosphingosinicella sp.]|uniref:DUF4170 domain-containing protein n=1 Tax=Allosphingosinicella sp. TaxID=2823234 RepID=UPI002FC12327
MTIRYWIVGGEYADPDFRSLIPGTETMSGPFEDERKARNEWIRLTHCPHATSATTRYSIASEAML